MAFHPIEDNMYGALEHLGKIAEYLKSKGQHKVANDIGKLSILVLEGWKISIEDVLIPEDKLNEQPSSDPTLKDKLAVDSQQALVSPKVDDDQRSKSGVSTIHGITDIPTEGSVSNGSDGSLVDDKDVDNKQIDDSLVDEKQGVDTKPIYNMTSDIKVIDKNAMYGKSGNKPLSDIRAVYTRFGSKPVSDRPVIDSQATYNKVFGKQVFGKQVFGNKATVRKIGDRPVIDSQATYDKVFDEQVPKGNGETAQAGSLALVPAGYHSQTGNTAPYGQGQKTEGVPSPEQSFNSSEGSNVPAETTKSTETTKSPDPPEEKAGVILIHGPFGPNFVAKVTSRIHQGPLQDIRMVSRGIVKVVFQHASHARAFLETHMDMTNEPGSGRYGYFYDMKLVETIDWNDDHRRMNQPIRERRRLSFARKSMFEDHAAQERWKQDIYEFAGPGNVDFLWVFNNGNATAVFTSTIAARRVFKVFNELSKGHTEYSGISVTFSSDPCEKELVLARDRGRPIRNNHRGNYRGRGNRGNRGRGFYSRGGGGIGNSSRTTAGH